MEHISIVKMQLKFPFIYAEYEDGKKFKYEINEMIPEREEYKKLLDIDFFNIAKLGVKGWDMYWNDRIDIPSNDVREFGEEIEEF